MEFQVHSVTLEDRYPRGLPDDVRREDLVYDHFHRTVQGVEVEKKVERGCIAFVFGRAADGRSVCVRVEGVRPRLLFALDGSDGAPPTEDLGTLRRELDAEVRHEGVDVKSRSMCHAYGYEPDEAAPSGRVRHPYAEVFYPNLRSWRKACRLRKVADYHRLRRAVEEARRAMADAEDDMEARKKYDLLCKREALAKEAWDEWTAEHGGDEGDVGTWLTYRPAQEIFVDPLTRFLQEAGIRPSRWYRVPVRHVDVPVTTCDVELWTTVDDDAFVAVEDRTLNAPLVNFYYDIETMGLDPQTNEVVSVSLVFSTDGGGPPRHCLVAVGSVAPIPNVEVFECHDEAALLRRFTAIVKEADPDFVVAYNGINFDNRFLLVRAEKLHVEEFFYLSRFALRPARLRELKLQSSGMGDNVLRYFDMPGRANFDWYVKFKRDLPSEDSYKLDYFTRKFLGEPKVELGCGLVWRRVRGEEATATLDAPALAAALGAGTVRFSQAEWVALGVDATLDSTTVVRSDDGLFYRPALVGYRAIAPLQHGTAADRARLGYYCVDDAAKLYRLDKARTMTVEILQFCGVFGIVAEWVYFRGQQVRFVAQLLRKVRTAEEVPMVMNRPAEGFFGEGVDTFDGATVNEPKSGFYRSPPLLPPPSGGHDPLADEGEAAAPTAEEAAALLAEEAARPSSGATTANDPRLYKNGPVLTLDWKSLYPALIIAYNLCHSTWVGDPRLFDQPWVRAHHIRDDFVTRFVHKSHKRGILPRILEELLAERKAAKKQMAIHGAASKEAPEGSAERARHEALAKVFDGRQLALKVACNSCYGATGTRLESGGKWPNLAISATTTHEGRQAMVTKKTLLAEWYPDDVDVVYGDTDSVMLTFKSATTVEAAAARAREASGRITRHFRDEDLEPMELEFEKVYDPYLLQRKKRYAGLKFEEGKDGVMVCKGIDAKGIETERKDTLPFTKECMDEVLQILMYKRDAEAALARFQELMRTLVEDRVPIEKLKLQKTLSSKVESKTTTIAQAAVNAKRREREAGSEVSTNELVEYVMVNGHKSSKATELAEDYYYAKEHGLKLNRRWYFEHCIEESVGKLFSVFPGVDFKAVCDVFRAQLDAQRLGVSSALRDLQSGEGSSSSVSADAVPVSRREMLPPPPRKKKPRK